MTRREVIHPPRGYGIGFYTGNAATIVGCFATEDEARAALADAHIVVTGAPDGWHNWCGATDGVHFCNKPKGHAGNFHANGAGAWPVAREVLARKGER